MLFKHHKDKSPGAVELGDHVIQTVGSSAVKGVGATIGAIESATDPLSYLAVSGAIPNNPNVHVGDRIHAAGEKLAPNNEKFNDTTQGLLHGAEITAETIAPFGGQLAAGAQILKRAKGVTENLGLFKKILAESAQNPAMFAAVEASIMQISGQTSEFLIPDDNPLHKLLIELSTQIGLPGLVKLTQKTYSWFSRRVFPSVDQSEVALGEFFEDIFKEDPQAMKNLQESKRLEESSGVHFDTRQATKNPRIAGAADAVGFDDGLQSVEARTQIASFVNKIRPQKGENRADFQSRALKAVHDETARLQAEINKVVPNFTSNILDPTAAGSRELSGAERQAQMVKLRNKASRYVSGIYEQISNFKVNPKVSQSIVKAAQQAGKTARTAPGTKPIPVNEELQEILSMVTSNFKPGRPGTTKSVNVDPITGKNLTLNKAQRAESTTHRNFKLLQTIDSKLSEFIRAAQKDGRADDLRRANILKSSITRAYKNLSNDASLAPDDLILLKQGKVARTRFGKLFQDGALGQALQMSSQGQLKVSPEDFYKMFIKTDNAKDSHRAARQYRAAFGGSAESMVPIKQELYRRFLASAVKQGKDGVDSVDVKGARNWLKNHKEVIASYDMTDDFYSKGGNLKQSMEDLVDTAHGQLEDASMALRDVEKTAFASFAKADDPRSFVRGLLKSPDKLRKFNKQLHAEGGSNDVQGFKDMIMEELLESTMLKSTEKRFDESVRLFDNKMLDEVMMDHGAVLRQVLGSEHWHALKQLNKILNQTVIPKGTNPGIDLATVPMLSAVATATTGKMAATGFLSKTFVAMYLAGRVGAMAQSQIRREVMHQALSDPDYALALVAKAKDTNIRRRLIRLFVAPIVHAGEEASAGQEEDDKLNGVVGGE
jgi:hypothetical protein